MRRPRLYSVAGSNGAGKTTFAARFLPKFAATVDFINADLIAKGLSPFDVGRAATAAGRIALHRFNELAVANRSFALESTLSGIVYARRIRQLQSQGYGIHLFYLWIPDPGFALKRIRHRVRLGGHNVPAAIVRRRYARTLRNLFAVYWPLADHVQLLDNRDLEPRLIAESQDRKLVVTDLGLYNRIRGSVSSRASTETDA